VRLCDGPIYTRCESEVVRINHETPHPASLAGGTSYLLRCGRFAAPYPAETTQQLRCPIFMRTSVGMPQRREAACCERNLGSTVFCAWGLKAWRNFRCQVASTIGRPHEVTYPQS
jgi:hypothetical protein